MKRLTIDQTWEQCLKMWKWISRRCKGRDTLWCLRNVGILKIEWLAERGIVEDEIFGDCFFCEYRAHSHGKKINGDCFCPARKIDEDFMCMDTPYGYAEAPRLFYAELKRLNKIRLERKKK